jgi:hypothetical protein
MNVIAVSIRVSDIVALSATAAEWKLPVKEYEEKEWGILPLLFQVFIFGI